MFHGHKTNYKINRLQERALRLIYNNHISSFEELLSKDGTFTIHEQTYFTSTCCPSCPRTFLGPFHRLSLALLKYALSPDMYFVSLLLLILLLSACHIFSEFSHAVNASLALCKASRLSVRILLVFKDVIAVGLSINVGGRVSWKGENPWTFASEFLAFRHQDKARSRLNCDSLLNCFIHHICDNELMPFN